MQRFLLLPKPFMLRCGAGVKQVNDKEDRKPSKFADWTRSAFLLIAEDTPKTWYEQRFPGYFPWIRFRYTIWQSTLLQWICSEAVLTLSVVHWELLPELKLPRLQTSCAGAWTCRKPQWQQIVSKNGLCQATYMSRPEKLQIRSLLRCPSSTNTPLESFWDKCSCPSFIAFQLSTIGSVVSQRPRVTFNIKK
jgi:hypothetical protein